MADAIEIASPRDEQRIAKLVRDLDAKRRARIRAERQALALRLALARVMDQPRRAEAERERRRKAEASVGGLRSLNERLKLELGKVATRKGKDEPLTDGSQRNV
jgi:hypothetical protein